MTPIPGIALHARERMVERFGHDLPRDAWLQVFLDIQDGRSLMLQRHPHGTEIHAVQVGAVVIRFVYDPRFGSVVTVLADGMKTNMARAEAARNGRARQILTFPKMWKRGAIKGRRALRTQEVEA